MAVELLGDDTAWMQATDVLLGRPGDAGVNGLYAALPTLAPDRRAAVIHRLGIRRDTRTVSRLARHAESSDPAIATAALTALGDIGSVEAAKVLAMQPPGDTTYDACLRASSRLAEDGETEAAVSLYSLVWNAPKARPWQRAAALVGLAGVRPGQTVDIVRAHLASPDRHLRNGAARALLQLDASALAAMRAGYPSFDTPTRLALLHAWATQGVRAAEPEFLDALGQMNDVLQAAAVRGLRRVGSVAAVAPLLDTALENKDLARDAIATLARIPGEDMVETLYAAIDDPDPERAARAIEVVGLRRPPGYLDRLVLVMQQDRRGPFRETITVLRNAATPAQIPALRTGLLSAPADRARDLALALVAISQRQDDPQACLAKILDPEPELAGTARAAMLNALPALGGDRALDFVVAIRDEPSVRALIKWPDEAAVKPLLAILEDPETEEDLRKLVVAGLVPYAKRILPADRQVRVLRLALDQVAEESLRSGLLQTLADLSSVNLARGKPVTASDPHQGGNTPALAVDGDPATYWGCATSPTSLTVDLESVQTLARIRVITYHADRRFYQYQAAVSADGRSWMPVADMTANTTLATEAGTTHRFAPTPARYLRVTMLKNSANPGMHICELEAYSATPTEEQTP
jgi:HEAT repeat protein